jgi:hypothetical protein
MAPGALSLQIVSAIASQRSGLNIRADGSAAGLRDGKTDAIVPKRSLAPGVLSSMACKKLHKAYQEQENKKK